MKTVLILGVILLSCAPKTHTTKTLKPLIREKYVSKKSDSRFSNNIRRGEIVIGMTYEEAFFAQSRIDQGFKMIETDTGRYLLDFYCEYEVGIFVKKMNDTLCFYNRYFFNADTIHRITRDTTQGVVFAQKVTLPSSHPDPWKDVPDEMKPPVFYRGGQKK